MLTEEVFRALSADIQKQFVGIVYLGRNSYVKAALAPLYNRLPSVKLICTHPESEKCRFREFIKWGAKGECNKCSHLKCENDFYEVKEK